MGLRAIRYCLRFPDAFRNQLRAVLRASHYGPSKMMYPMISGVGEIIEANRILTKSKHPSIRKVSPMTETCQLEA